MDPIANIVADIESLEALYDHPGETSLRKVSPHLTDAYRRMIEASPFLAMATIGPEGMDCSPRGDIGPVLRVLDDKTLALPDWRGNNRLDTLRNIVRDGRCALLCMIPGVSETLRVNGQAKLSTDPKLCARFEQRGKHPISVIVIEIAEVYFQCARAITRSQIWDPASHVERAQLPSAGEMTKSAHEAFDATAYDAELAARQARTLY